MAIETAFLGTLGKNAESKISGSGKPYLRLNVRVDDGDQAQWISVMVFDQDAVKVVDKLTKGARAYIEGRLSLSEWAAQDGAKRHGLSVMSWHCRLAQIGRNKVKRDKPASGKGAAAHGDYAPIGRTDADLSDDIPF
jgi:single-stranded DNA-binding protein